MIKFHDYLLVSSKDKVSKQVKMQYSDRRLPTCFSSVLKRLDKGCSMAEVHRKVKK